MPRYFIEVAYKGTNYSGFQQQANAVTIQSEIEKVFGVYFRKEIVMTGSSRTDAGVHATQNFFHFDIETAIPEGCLYNLNAILPDDIVIRQAYRVGADAHCRFDALTRRYRYYVYRKKDPFLNGQAYYFPYTLDREAMQQAAAIIRRHTDFTSFSKRNTQVKTFLCDIKESLWIWEREYDIYEVRANRFLRGMVRGLVGTMLQVGRGRMSLSEFDAVIEARDNRGADFAVPGTGLFLEEVNYPEGWLASPLGEWPK